MASLTVLDNVAGEGLNTDAWFNGTGAVFVNGSISNIFAATGGDIDLNFGVERAIAGAEVPEPATALLLGLGALGGAIKRRKSA